MKSSTILYYSITTTIDLTTTTGIRLHLICPKRIRIKYRKCFVFVATTQCVSATMAEAQSSNPSLLVQSMATPYQFGIPTQPIAAEVLQLWIEVGTNLDKNATGMERVVDDIVRRGDKCVFVLVLSLSLSFYVHVL